MAGLSKIIAQRLLLGLVTLLVVSIIIFIAVNALPGDFAQAILGQGATPESVAAIREQLGLDQNAISRYLSWLGGALRGDLGVPLSQALFAGNFGTTATGTDVITVMDQIAPRLSNTLYLAGLSAIIAVPLSIILGLLTALYRNSAFDKAMNVTTLSAISSPEFFIAYVLILFLAVLNPMLPSLSNVNPDMAWFGWDRLNRTLLPALVLTLAVTAQMMRMTRAAIINLLASPYIEMARLKGMSPMRVIVKHALPNALAPIITVVALNLAFLITGVVVVEVVFVYPGIGQLFVDSVKIRDIPVVQACCLIFAAVYILLNLTADILSIISNPRLRHPK